MDDEELRGLLTQWGIYFPNEFGWRHNVLIDDNLDLFRSIVEHDESEGRAVSGRILVNLLTEYDCFEAQPYRDLIASLFLDNAPELRQYSYQQVDELLSNPEGRVRWSTVGERIAFAGHFSAILTRLFHRLDIEAINQVNLMLRRICFDHSNYSLDHDYFSFSFIKAIDEATMHGYFHVVADLIAVNTSFTKSDRFERLIKDLLRISDPC